MFGVEELMELMKNLPIPCWLLGSIVILSAGIGPVPATAVHEFTAHRMQHFDMYGVRYGSRSALINMEAKGETANMLNRRCVVVRWRDLTIEKFLSLIERGAGSILVLLPPKNSSAESHMEWESWVMLEAELFKAEIPIPVYFIEENKELAELHELLTRTAEREKDSSVASLLLSAVSDYGYQIVAGDSETKPIKGLAVTTVIGTLNGQHVGRSLPTLAILAHYDAMGLAPSLSYGVDSNASGAAALIEMSRMFSRLYRNPNLRPKYNLVFVLSGGGKFNYVGTKGLLEDLDGSDAASLLSSADYTLCLDSLSMADSSNLYVHVSKPPKEGARGHLLLQYINESAEALFPDLNMKLVHKKVRLSEDLLAWEHERFSLKRLPAATVSSLQNHKDLRRSSMFVAKSQTDINVLTRNVHILAEGIARFIYNVSELGVSLTSPILSESGYSVSSGFLEMWVEFLTSHARSLQLLDSSHPVVLELEHALKRYTDDVTTLTHIAQKSEQEFVIYDTANTKMTAYRVKPAVFDLFVAITIALYSSVWFFLIVSFNQIRKLVIVSLPLPFAVRASSKSNKMD